MQYCRIHQIETCKDRGGCCWVIAFGYHCTDKKAERADIAFQEVVINEEPDLIKQFMKYKLLNPTLSKRRFLFEHAKAICYLCNKKIESFKDASIDHVVPKFHGGKNDVTNCRIAHRSCNSKKGSKLLEELNANDFIK